MFKSIKLYIYGIVTIVISILGSLFVSTRKENKVLKKVNKSQEEALEIVEVVDKVTTIVHKASVQEEASIDNSIKEIKQKVSDNETIDDKYVLDPEFIRLLDERTGKVPDKKTTD